MFSAKITNFIQVTGCADETIADYFLKKNKLHLNNAIDDFYANGHVVVQESANAKVISQIFDKYTDNDSKDQIGIDGALSYFSDMGIDVENDVEALIAAYILKSPSTCIFNKTEFVSGWCNVSPEITSVADMARYLHHAKNNCDLMKKVHNFAFMYALDEGERKLEIDAAVALWKIIYKTDFAHFEETGKHTTVTKFVIDFIVSGKSGKSQISRDEWEMSYDFFVIPLVELENYSESEAWPVLMDDFVDFLFGRV